MERSYSSAPEEIAELRRQIAELRASSAASPSAASPSAASPPAAPPSAASPPAAPPAKGVIIDRLLALARTALPEARRLAEINLTGTSLELTRLINLRAELAIHDDRNEHPAVTAKVAELTDAVVAAQRDYDGLTYDPPRYVSELESLRGKTDADLRASLCAFLDANTFLMKAIFGNNPRWYGSCTVPPGWREVSLAPCGRLDIDLCLLVGGIVWNHTDSGWDFDSIRRKIVVAIADILAIKFSDADITALTTAIAFGKI